MGWQGIYIVYVSAHDLLGHVVSTDFVNVFFLLFHYTQQAIEELILKKNNIKTRIWDG